MIDLTPIFQAIIALLAALVTYKLIPWIKARTTETQQANLNALAKVAVYAAEQIYGAGQGDKKMEYARNILLSAGFDVNLDVLRAAIESAVHNMPDYIFGGIDDGETANEPQEDAPLGKLEEEDPDPEENAGAEEAPGIVEPPPDGGE